MSQQRQAFTEFLSPIQLLFRIFCWAPTCRSEDKPIYTNVICYYLTVSHFIFTMLALFRFNWLYLPDDVTNRAVIIFIVMAYTVLMVESFAKQSNYRRIVNHFQEFDQEYSKTVPENDLHLICKQWKWVYYHKIFARLAFFAVCEVSGLLIYFHSKVLRVRLVGLLLGIGKIGIYTKAIQIAFYMDMIRERLEFVKTTLLRGKKEKQVTIMYALLWQICEELNTSIGATLIVFYLQTVIDLVNVSHIMYWNLVVRYTNMETIGVFAFAVTILMPMWELIMACQRCQNEV